MGAARPHHVDVRILAATNQDLEEKIRDRSFREDLFYRLNVVTIRTPTLKEIKADIPLLVNHFTRLACIELGINLKRFSPRAFEVLMGRPWPGNVRELQNIVRRAVIFCPESIIKPEDVELEQEGAGQGKRICLELDKLGEGLEPYKQAKERVLTKIYPEICLPTAGKDRRQCYSGGGTERLEPGGSAKNQAQIGGLVWSSDGRFFGPRITCQFRKLSWKREIFQIRFDYCNNLILLYISDDISSNWNLPGHFGSSRYRESRRGNQAFNFEIAPVLLCLPKIEHDLLVQPAFSRCLKSQR